MSFTTRDIWRYCIGDKFTIDETPSLFVSQDSRGVVYNRKHLALGWKSPLAFERMAG